MIDVHTHILPLVDDGSESLEESLRMIEREISLGVTDIIITSHALRLDLIKVSKQELMDAFAKFSTLVQNKYNVKLYLGQEVAYSDKMISLLKNNELLTINNTEHLLLELPFDQAINDIDEVIFSCRILGYKVIIAHVERYQYYNFKQLVDLKKLGVLFQINSNSITGRSGKDLQKLSFKLFKSHMVDLVGSDVHAFRHNDLDEAFAIVSKRFGEETADLVFSQNAKTMFHIS
ncbi:MAG: tyrosine-protein phosphatase [Bacilli bacterium]